MENLPLVTVDFWTLIAQMCNLLIQMYLIKRFLLKPVMAVVEKRKAMAEAQLTDAAKAKEEAEAMKAEYEQNMAQAKAEASELLTSATRTAQSRSEEILRDAQSQATAIKQKAEADIEQEKKKAVNDVKDEIGGIAMEIASKVVAREVSQDDHAALIDEFIKKVGDAS